MSAPYYVWKMLKEAFWRGVGGHWEASWSKWDISWTLKDGDDLNGHDVERAHFKGGKREQRHIHRNMWLHWGKKWATKMVKMKCLCRAELANTSLCLWTPNNCWWLPELVLRRGLGLDLGWEVQVWFPRTSAINPRTGFQSERGGGGDGPSYGSKFTCFG